jgi:hypothetical protein
MPYPPPPGPRIAYDINGTVGTFRAYDGIVKDVHPNALRHMNSERNHMAVAGGNSGLAGNWGPFGAEGWMALIFPVPMRLYGLFVNFGGDLSFSAATPNLVPVMSTSPNSTNGSDGSWYALATLPIKALSPFQSVFTGAELLSGAESGYDTSFVVNDLYRKSSLDNGIIPVSGTAARHVRALKLTGETPYSFSRSGYMAMHVYGEPDTDTSDSILLFYDPNEELTAPGDMLDWGDVPQGTTADKRFRLKNNSAAQTAYNIVINAQMGIATTTPVPSDSFLFSVNGTTWTTSITLAALSPDAVSGQLYVRRTTPLNAQPSNWAPRVVATVGSWS